LGYEKRLKKAPEQRPAPRLSAQRLGTCSERVAISANVAASSLSRITVSCSSRDFRSALIVATMPISLVVIRGESGSLPT
jgi:hypothetical protein